MTYATEKLAKMVANTNEADIPEATYTAAERALLDCIASTLGGVSTRNAIASRTAMKATFGPGSHMPWFCAGTGLHKLGALFSNCAAASALDIDDGHRGAAGHPGAAIIPAVLLEAQELSSTGQDVLTAIIIGYDVALRIASARRHHDTISFASGIWTGYGVAAALARLQRLPEQQIAHAISIAGQEAPQNLPQGACTASSVKGSSPWSTVTAYTACARAQAGATGSIDLLDRSSTYDIDAIVGDLGQKWLINDIYFKLYAACRYGHPVIDAILHLRKAYQFDPTMIQALRVEIFAEAAKLPNSVTPTSLEDAQFSIPFIASLAALKGASAFVPMAEDALSDPEVRALAAHMEITYPDSLKGKFPASTPAKVTIVVDGNEMVHSVSVPRGDPSNPISDDEIAQKLHLLDRGISKTKKLDKLIATLRQIRNGSIAQTYLGLATLG